MSAMYATSWRSSAAREAAAEMLVVQSLSSSHIVVHCRRCWRLLLDGSFVGEREMVDLSDVHDCKEMSV